MPDRRHSVVFDLLSAVDAAVQAATFPPHPATARGPVLDQDVQPIAETADEYVVVSLAVDDGQSVAWSRIGPAGRDETVGVDVEIGTRVPGRTRAQVLTRLEELADVVQGVFYDPTTFEFTPPAVTVQLGGLSGVTCDVYGTDSGHAGVSTVRFQFQARL